MIWRSWSARTIAYALTATLAVMLPGCGGGGGSSPTTPSTPPPPVKQLITQGNFQLTDVAGATAVGLPYDTFFVPITTSAVGTLEMDADWTFASSNIILGLERSPCSINQFYALQCTDVASSSVPSPKPGRLVVSNLAAGSYVFVILNPSVNAEAGNYQVYLTR